VKRAIVLALSVILALLVAVPIACGQAAQDAVTSEQAREWAADWGIWAFDKKSTSESPLVGGYTGGAQCNGLGPNGSSDKVWFLAGTLDGSKVTRTCDAPTEYRIFFPVYNITDVNTPGAQTEEELQQEDKGWTDAALAKPKPKLFATVDGTTVEMKRLDSPSSLFHFTFPPNNPVNFRSGNYVGVTDGVWVALPPLPEGQHTIHFGGNGQDNTYKLTVK
jgi:hypothetical protein